MADKKLSDEQVKELISELNSGKSPANLASKWGIHPTTIRRYWRQNGRKAGRQAHRTLIGHKEKVALREVLTEFKVANMDALISELDLRFSIAMREPEEDEDFPTIYV